MNYRESIDYKFALKLCYNKVITTFIVSFE